MFWVSFSLCFLKIHYTQPEVWIITEYQVNILMEVLILTLRHSSSPATAGSAHGIAYGVRIVSPHVCHSAFNDAGFHLLLYQAATCHRMSFAALCT